jgi:transcriptional regulator with XRE-family HTH domain
MVVSHPMGYKGNLENDQACSVGRAIKLYREKKQLSQKELALYAGVSPSYIAYIEKGTRSPCTLLQLPFEAESTIRSEFKELIDHLNLDEILFMKTIAEAYFQHLRGKCQKT